MSIYDEKLKKYKNMAAEKFKNHKADYRRYKDARLSVLDWRNASGDGCYYMRVVFDEARGNMYITGDIGEAVFRFRYDGIKLDDMPVYLNDINYFLEKCSCASDKYYYDEDAAKAEIIERLKEMWFESVIYSADEFADSLIECLDDAYGISDIPERIEDELKVWDEAYYDWLYDAGKMIHPRVILWVEGLKMAYKQIRKERDK